MLETPLTPTVVLRHLSSTNVTLQWKKSKELMSGGGKQGSAGMKRLMDDWVGVSKVRFNLTLLSTPIK